MAWVGVRLLGGAASELGSGRVSPRDILASVNPIGPSLFISFANVFFILLILAAGLISVALIKKKYREAVMYEFTFYRGWLVLCLSFLSSAALFIAAFQFSNTGVEETPPVSAAGTIIAIVVSIFAGMNVLSHWHNHRKKA
jgi:hypothetical protein